MSVAQRANFSTLLRYAQGWEDPVVSAKGTAIGPTSRVLTICGAGDFALWFLACDAKEVIAVDLNPVQIYALQLRLAALSCLSNEELLVLFGSRQGERLTLLDRCTEQLAGDARGFWESQRAAVATVGAAGVGKFERYFETFRRRVLPCCHSRRDVAELLTPGRTRSEREEFFDRVWNNWRWRTLFRVFFSRQVMALLGRSPAQFEHAPQLGLAAALQARVRHALVELDPADNPFLQWILTGHHPSALPPWMTRLDDIRKRTERLQIRQAPLEEVVDGLDEFDAAHLSDVFEYMSAEDGEHLLVKLVGKLSSGGRLAYWNMAVPRSAPSGIGLKACDEEARRLHAEDRAFFYQKFVLEERCQL